MAKVADTKHRDLRRALENGSVMSWGGEGVSLSGSLQKLMAERVLTFQLIIRPFGMV